MYMYKDIFRNRYIYLFIHIFIIRSWLTSLQRLMIFKICSWQAGDPRELMVSFQFEGQKASDLGKGVLLDFKGRKKLMSSLEGCHAGGIPLYLREVQPFCSIQAFN